MTTAELTKMYESLSEDQQRMAESYVLFLYNGGTGRRRQKSIDAVRELNALFADDKGWESEEAMIADMAEFRRERVAAAKAAEVA